MKSMKYNLIIDEIQPEDYVLGGFTKIPQEVLQEDQDWTPYLPIKELQADKFETWACVSFTVLNCIEALIKRKYGEERNWSDRFLAVASGTSEGGNSPHKVAEFLRAFGVVPEDIYPFEAENYKDFNKPIPQEIYDIALEFLSEFEFKHEFVKAEDIDEALKSSPLLISVKAWYNDGEYYYSPEGMKDNHATTYVKRLKDSRLVFDSYDSVMKKVRLDHKPMIAKRFWIKKKAKENKDLEKKDIDLDVKKKISIIQFLRSLWN